MKTFVRLLVAAIGAKTASSQVKIPDVYHFRREDILSHHDADTAPDHNSTIDLPAIGAATVALTFPTATVTFTRYVTERLHVEIQATTDTAVDALLTTWWGLKHAAYVQGAGFHDFDIPIEPTWAGRIKVEID
ncbi:uncharacterized protein SETTUDRAFT_40162 [Exserohilum turcica Et28A]|uniref:Uncharacterized protein n=1 Tax=Exserohilum turcicum (strain 28A) TaxID=671987 RepID=R0K856_EXST2|nr:uncharacterized protein SETTUDRAFT_40162 [Exserohilum turcica Et28A]EOA85639.1 hypothetical protein SETTUDRAFT_40162 [Exserohilum turcica Et28A]